MKQINIHAHLNAVCDQGFLCGC